MSPTGLVRIVREEEVVFVDVLQDGHFNAQPEKLDTPQGNVIADFLRDEKTCTALASHAKRLKPKGPNDFEQKNDYWDWCERWQRRNGMQDAYLLPSLLQLLREKSPSEVEVPSETRYEKFQEFYYTIDLTSKTLTIKWCYGRHKRIIKYQFSNLPPNNELHIRLYNPDSKVQESKIERLQEFEFANEICIYLRKWLFEEGMRPKLS